MAVSQEKITVHSLADLKNTSDDAIPVYLNSLKFKQSHILTDVRLTLGYTAFSICAATFYWDYKFGFDTTKTYTLIAVLLYTTLNTLLTFWIYFIEKGKVYVGKLPSNQKIEIATSTKKHVPIYNVTVTVHSSNPLDAPQVFTIRRSFTEWFDKQGHFVSLPFQQMFASEVGVIGEADPKRVVKGGKAKKEPVEDGRSMEDKWTALLKESQGVGLDEVAGISTGAAATPGKGKKRGKKP